MNRSDEKKSVTVRRVYALWILRDSDHCLALTRKNVVIEIIPMKKKKFVYLLT